MADATVSEIRPNGLPELDAGTLEALRHFMTTHSLTARSIIVTALDDVIDVEVWNSDLLAHHAWQRQLFENGDSISHPQADRAIEIEARYTNRSKHA